MPTIFDSTQPINYKSKSYYIPPSIITKEASHPLLQYLYLTWVGLYTKAQNHVVHHRTLEDFVLIYCVTGEGWLSINNEKYTIHSGDLFICPPNLPHSYGSSKIDPWTKFWIHFNGENSDEYVKLLGISVNSPIINIHQNPKIISWFQDIFEILDSGYTQDNLLFTASYLRNILLYINNSLINLHNIKGSDTFVQAAITFMQSNYKSNITLDELATHMNISKYHFSHTFKQKTGYSPMDFFIRLKIQKACELLELTSLNINKISSTLGFNTPYYFSLTFKRIIGLSPTHYRAKLK